MNELQIVEYEGRKMKGLEIKEIDGRRYVTYLGRAIDKYALLSMAVKSSSTKHAWDILDAAEIYKNDNVYKSLHYAVSFLVVDREFRNNEFFYHDLFKKTYPLISGSEIIKIKNDGKNIPDVWVFDRKENIPVEIKRKDFGKNALQQLKRYIKAYNCEHGIAVAERLTVKLPENIKFVPISELLEFERGFIHE